MYILFYLYNCFCAVYRSNLCRATFAVWITKRTSLASILFHDEESDALHKINDYIIKIQNTNTLDVKTCPQSCWLFVVEQVMKAIAVHFVHEWSAERRSYPWSVPAEHDSSSAWESAPLRGKQQLQSGPLLLNYIGLMLIFTSNVC